jgi:hypothetical protein
VRDVWLADDRDVEEQWTASYIALYEGFVRERQLGHDPAVWGEAEIAMWRVRYAEWEAAWPR